MFPPHTACARCEDLDDQALMPLIGQGNVRALEVLHERHRAAALGLARRMCGPDLADDVVQATFVSAWRNVGQYRAECGSPRSWLLGIVHNRAVDHLRWHATRRRNTVSSDGLPELAGEGRDAHRPRAYERAAQIEERDAVRRLLLMLPPEQRTVLTLAYVGGFTSTQIAAALNVPVGTIKSRARLGLAKLRREWDSADGSLAAA